VPQPLAAHAATLAPAVRVGESDSLIRLLGSWGAAAASATPQLTALLGTALASEPAGGPWRESAEPAVALHRHMLGSATAWAYGRITGDPDLLLARPAEDSAHMHLSRLGYLGSLAFRVPPHRYAPSACLPTDTPPFRVPRTQRASPFSCRRRTGGDALDRGAPIAAGRCRNGGNRSATVAHRVGDHRWTGPGRREW
jgi:hypothetical protein